MSRYVDVDKYPSREWLIDFLYDCGIRADISVEDVADELLFILSDLPTANVVEVVRCKDCTRQMICFHSDAYFCADGERGEDDKNRSNELR